MINFHFFPTANTGFYCKKSAPLELSNFFFFVPSVTLNSYPSLLLRNFALEMQERYFLVTTTTLPLSN